MDAGWLHALLPVAALAVNATAQIANYWLCGRKRLLRSVYAGFLAGALCVFAGEAWLWSRTEVLLEAAGYAIANLLLYGALGYGYFHFINLGETGRRVRLMWELLDAPDGLSDAELRARYGARQIVEIRLGRLLRSGQVNEREGRYRIARPTVLAMARILVLLKRLLLKKESEFD